MSETIDMLGKTFGQWTVLFQVDSKNGAVWRCRCSCGTLRDIHGGALRAKQASICKRCQTNTSLKKARTENFAEYRSYVRLKNRCTNKNYKYFYRYGGRGIKVCERWLHSFENFLADMGPKPTPQHTIDRKDNNGDYEPDNCRWATMSEQGVNKQNTIFITYDGKTLPLRDWAEITGLSYSCLISRHARKWSLEKILLGAKFNL